MKNLICVAMVLTIATSACGQKTSSEKEISMEMPSEIGHYGEEITKEGAVAVADLAGMMQKADSVDVKVTGEIAEVCQAKGCWMTMDLGDGELMRIKFKDYGFFVPKDSHGKQAVIAGKAKKEVISVATQRHFAEDAGKSKEEIEAITDDEVGYTFLAHGVIIE